MENSEYYIYLLESKSDGIWYVGLSKNPDERLKQHNQAKSKFTKGHLPWKLLYKEKIDSLKEARTKEKYYILKLSLAHYNLSYAFLRICEVHFNC